MRDTLRGRARHDTARVPIRTIRRGHGALGATGGLCAAMPSRFLCLWYLELDPFRYLLILLDAPALLCFALDSRSGTVKFARTPRAAPLPSIHPSIYFLGGLVDVALLGRS